VNQTLIWAYLLLCLTLANLPWLTQRVLMVKSLSSDKSVWMILVEWLLYALIALGAGWALEWQLTGSVKDQDWEFFVSVLFMFAIMSFPGLIWKQQRSNQKVKEGDIDS
jgi:hypothetical protein